MINVQNLSKAFGELRAVDRISFTVSRGELFGFLGPNGAGKTTAINMISGLLRPDGGTVFIENYNVWESPRPAKRSLGLVPQDLALYEEFSARENLLASAGRDPAADSTVRPFVYDGSQLLAWPAQFEAIPGTSHGVNVATGSMGY